MPHELADYGVVPIEFFGPLGYHFGFGVAAFLDQTVEVVEQHGQLLLDHELCLPPTFDLFPGSLILFFQLDTGAVLVDELPRFGQGTVHAPEQSSASIRLQACRFHVLSCLFQQGQGTPRVGRQHGSRFGALLQQIRGYLTDQHLLTLGRFANRRTGIAGKSVLRRIGRVAPHGPNAGTLAQHPQVALQAIGRRRIQLFDFAGGLLKVLIGLGAVLVLQRLLTQPQQLRGVGISRSCIGPRWNFLLHGSRGRGQSRQARSQPVGYPRRTRRLRILRHGSRLLVANPHVPCRVVRRVVKGGRRGMPLGHGAHGGRDLRVDARIASAGDTPLPSGLADVEQDQPGTIFANTVSRVGHAQSIGTEGQFFGKLEISVAQRFPSTPCPLVGLLSSGHRWDRHARRLLPDRQRGRRTGRIPRRIPIRAAILRNAFQQLRRVAFERSVVEPLIGGLTG